MNTITANAQTNTADLGKFLLCALVTIRLEEGYVSNANAANMMGKQSTAKIAWQWATVGRPEKYKSAEVLQDERVQAKKIFDWLTGLNPLDSTNNAYMYKLAQIGQAKQVNETQTGIAASAINAYEKEQTKQQAATGNGFVGTVNEKIIALVYYLGVNTFDSKFGVCHKHRFCGMNKELISWITSKDQDALGLVQGNRYTVSGTVKEHSEFKGNQETLVTRATVRAA